MYLAMDPQDRFESHADAITRGEAATPPVTGSETGLILVPQALAAHLEAQAGDGRPMSARLAREVGLATGVDIGWARLHCDRKAAQLCRALGARAFTLAGDVYVDDKVEDEVLRHELAHVAQWAAGPLWKNTLVIRRMIDFTPPQPQNFQNWSQGLQQNAPWYPTWIANNAIFQIDPPDRPSWIGPVLRLNLNYRQSRNHIIPFSLIEESLVGGLHLFFGSCVLACGQIENLLAQQNNVNAINQLLQNTNINLQNLIQPQYQRSRPEDLRELFRILQLNFAQVVPPAFQQLYQSLLDLNESITKLNSLVGSLYTIHQTEALTARYLVDAVCNACTANFQFPRLMCHGVETLLDLLVTVLNSSPDNVRAGNARMNQIISNNIDADFMAGTFQDANGIQVAHGPVVQPNTYFYRLDQRSESIIFEFMSVATDLMADNLNFVWNYDANNPNNRVPRYPLHVPLTSGARPVANNMNQDLPVVVFSQNQNRLPFRFG